MFWDPGGQSAQVGIAVEGLIGLSGEEFPQEGKQQVQEYLVKVLEMLEAFEADFEVVVEDVDLSLTEN